MLIDFHTHCFPDTLALRAIPKLSKASGGLIPQTDGTLSGLRDSMQKNGVDASVVLCIATNPHQQTKVNDFAASIHNGRDIFAFGSVHPKSPNALEELERIHAMGLPGVKLHPDYQGFMADDPALKPLYRKISSLGLITLFHAGTDLGNPPPYGGAPARIAAALPWLDGPVVAAHWGGIQCYENVLRWLCGTDVYLDTSMGYGCIPRYYAQKILENHSPDRVLFGSDTPWHSPLMEKVLLDTLDIAPADREKINYQNACRLLSIDM